MTYVGVDACSGGWFATVLSVGDVETKLHGSFSAVWSTHASADRILVDISIGLATDRRRRCDEDARVLLGCRGL